MEHHIQLDGHFHGLLILLKAGLFDAAQGCGGAAEPCISCHQILIVELSPAKAVSQLSGEEII